MFFIIEHTEKVFQNPDNVHIEDNKEIHTKHFDMFENFSIRIVTENIKNITQIKSIHLQKK